MDHIADPQTLTFTSTYSVAGHDNIIFEATGAAFSQLILN
jgi:hypothetical protein